MEDNQEFRWQQRFEQYSKALRQLESAVNTYVGTEEDIIKEGIIQRFEFTHELAWKVMQDILKFQGFFDVIGSRTATKMAFSQGLITNGEMWMEMIKSRNITVHTYDEHILNNEYHKITQDYLPLMIEFKQNIERLWKTLG